MISSPRSSEDEVQTRLKEVVEFEARLKKYGVDIDSFGKGKARSIDDLYWEVRRGESYLGHQNGKFKRLVSVLRLEIWAKTDEGDKLLVHTDERLEDRRVRKSLNERIAKKMSHDESVEDALMRALMTELRLDSRWFFSHLKIERIDEKLGESESPGCPGIMTIYHFHNVYARVVDPSHEDCAVIGLPKGEKFQTEELTMLQERKHRWDWFSGLEDDTEGMNEVVTKQGEDNLYFTALEFNEEQPVHSERRMSSLDSIDSEASRASDADGERSSRELGESLRDLITGESCPYVIVRKQEPMRQSRKILVLLAPALSALVAVVCGVIIRYVEFE
eukprot:gnl/MRDRNA2_/MRDRNA2_103170_c0_seq1.p1 gnl/MRDRNA2_/MRDRNA2_103170_c0~~gnl/MRDRNA2_/MRDRNA2_103170_c0_seq1.p1  ORF type:complete len:333 (-),score=69.00 gnl/MRDRNA2_/MRDRNA2_103170_c0_seq1:342-1340(-)